MPYTASRYNIASASVAGEIAVFNTLTQNLVIFSLEEYASLETQPVDDRIAALGFIVPTKLDEPELARKIGRQLRYQHKEGLALTVVPSAACNFSCGYCYNGLNHAKGDTYKAGQNALVYAQTHLLKGESLHVTWYGGEPSMFMNEIAHLSREFQALCKELDTSYSADILTNGSLLTAEVANVLAIANVEHIQISIDWPLRTSQRRWGSKDVRQSLIQILENAAETAPLIQTTIRVNAMPDFLETFDDLLDLLQPLRGVVGIYLHRVHESNVESLNTSHSEAFRYGQVDKFYEDYMVARNRLRVAGFKQPFFPESFESSVCIAQAERDLIFTPDGFAKKCVKEIAGVGVELLPNRDVVSGSERRMEFYRHGEAADESECASCTFLPICHGGCVKDMYEMPTRTAERCTPWKYTLSNDLTDYLKGKNEDRQG